MEEMDFEINSPPSRLRVENKIVGRYALLFSPPPFPKSRRDGETWRYALMKLLFLSLFFPPLLLIHEKNRGRRKSIFKMISLLPFPPPPFPFQENIIPQ